MEDFWEFADAGIRLVLGIELMVVPYLGFPWLGENPLLGLGSIAVGLVLCGTAVHRLLRG